MTIQEAKERGVLKNHTPEELIDMIIDLKNGITSSDKHNQEIINDRKDLLKDKEAYRTLALAICDRY